MSILLWVYSGRETWLNFGFGIEFFYGLSGELSAVVGCDFLWDSESAYDDDFGMCYVGVCFCFHPFGEVIRCDNRVFSSLGG